MKKDRSRASLAYQKIKINNLKIRTRAHMKDLNIRLNIITRLSLLFRVYRSVFVSVGRENVHWR